MTDDEIQSHLQAATRHAENTDEPQVEIDDLNVFLRALWKVMSPGQQQEFLKLEHVVETYAGALGVDIEDGEELTPATGVEDLIKAAKQHGEDSEPDMEPGDLQIFFMEGAKLLNAEQDAAFVDDKAVKDVLDLAGPAPSPRA